MKVLRKFHNRFVSFQIIESLELCKQLLIDLFIFFTRNVFITLIVYIRSIFNIESFFILDFLLQSLDLDKRMVLLVNLFLHLTIWAEDVFFADEADVVRSSVLFFAVRASLTQLDVPLIFSHNFVPIMQLLQGYIAEGSSDILHKRYEAFSSSRFALEFFLR